MTSIEPKQRQDFANDVLLVEAPLDGGPDGWPLSAYAVATLTNGCAVSECLADDGASKERLRGEALLERGRKLFPYPWHAQEQGRTHLRQVFLHCSKALRKIDGIRIIDSKQFTLNALRDMAEWEKRQCNIAAV